MAVNQAAMRRRARIMRAVNVPMRAALSLPFATPLGGNLMLISYTGRRSGKGRRDGAAGRLGLSAHRGRLPWPLHSQSWPTLPLAEEERSGICPRSGPYWMQRAPST